MNNGVKIMIMDGNNIKKEQEGREVFTEFKGVFANSLLLKKLRKLGLVESLGKTRDIIGLEFVHKYISLKAEDKINTVQEVKNGAKKISNDIKKLENKKIDITGGLKLKDIEDEELKKQAKEINVEIKSLKEKRKLINEEVKKMNKDIAENDCVSKADIRNDLYQNGFDFTFKKYNKKTDKYEDDKTIHYVFWFRSPSKTRTGDAIFINKELFDKIDNWQRMGIKLPDTNAKLVEMEAYKSLVSSAIESTLEFNPRKNLLVISDINSFSEYMCSVVTTNELGETEIENKPYNLCNVLFDGQMLLDYSMFKGKYKNKGMMVLRQHFFKACAFNSNIQLFIKDWCKENNKDYNTYEVVGKYGNKIKVKDILGITTENAMKSEKFFDDKKEMWNSWCEAVEADNNEFGIVKTTHETKYSKVGLQRMSYQMINTLPISKDKIENLLQDTINYVNGMKKTKNIDNFIEYLKATKDNTNENEMLLDIYNKNNDFSESYYFRDRKVKKFKKLKGKVQEGKLFITGDNLTVVGNPYTMLLASVNDVKTKTIIIDGEEVKNVVVDEYEDKTLPVIDNTCISVYAKRFDKDGEYLASFRNPHNAPNNIGYNKNIISDEMEKYFNFDKNIIAINMIRTNEQDRKNSEDMDSDFNLVTNNEVVVEGALKAQEYNTIVNNIEQSGKKYNNTMQDLAKIDNGLGKAKNDIGISSNEAQIAMSWFWHFKNNNNEEVAEELEGYVAILSVLAQCSIDNSKRQYAVNVAKEIGRIRKAINTIIKREMKQDKLKSLPTFWKYTNETFNKKKKQEKANAIKDLQNIDCPMNWIQDAIKFEGDSKKDRIPNLDFIENVSGKGNETMYNKIVEATKIYDTQNSKLHKEMEISKTDSDKEKINNKLAILQDDLIKAYSNVKLETIKDDERKTEKILKAMQNLIKSCLDVKGENRDYKTIMLKTLHKTHKKMFLQCFKQK
ncbi:coiled-coil domain-containing protein [Clostridium botulinum]|uniref:coiled-coil domain-containing protein n=1 Tax=Clostridium botulinum TaxID=1491 RepID=UPI001966CFD7|nr:hypothetical protein [Clostridium botulinum]